MKNKMIFNGGEPLEGCPDNWEDAYNWQDKSNENTIHESMEWSWDCGFKLDFDGSLLRVVSRFYPPKEYRGKCWNGSISFYVFDEEVKEEDFKADTLDQLKEDVELYVKKEAFLLIEDLKKPKGVNLTWHVILFLMGFILGGVLFLNLIP